MTTLKSTIAILSLSALLSACGGDGASDSMGTATSNRVTISGSVGDGPAVGATVTLKAVNGAVIETTTSDQQANYSVEIDVEPSDYPISLEATNGIDLVTGTTLDFTLVSVVTDLASTQANLNPHSTVITKTAQVMNGGLTETNLETAKRFVTAKLNFGLDTNMVGDPITASVDSSNAMVMNHSSEALAETVRRASTALGNDIQEDQLIDALSADLTDSLLDGKGTAGVNPRYTAVAHAVSLQVLLESMLGDLHVNGSSAEEAITAAIRTTLADSGDTANRSRRYKLNYLMFRQAKSALSCIQVIDPSVTLRDLMRVLRDLEDGASIEEMRAALEQYSLDLSISSSLDNTIADIADASEEEIDDICDAANPPDETEENRPPVISGSPAGSVAEGEVFSFTPTSADPDGDELTFSCANLPAWASCDSNNGRLSGTPDYGDAGVYNNIRISVSDGSASATLGPFSISVGGTNQSPIITGNPPANVNEGTNYSFIPNAFDADGDSLDFSIANLPVWASFNSNNGTLSGTPGYDDAGVYSNIVISVADGSASASLEAFSITVQDSNRAPNISGTPPASVTEGGSYSFAPRAADPDGDNLSFSIANLPAWASFNNNSGTLAGTPGFTDAGVYSDISISVSDGTASVMLDPFSITVTNTDENPTPTPVAGASILNSANLSGTSVVLAWTQHNAIPEGGYDIIVDGVDTNQEYRVPILLTATVPGIDTSVSHCFAIQARYTDSNQFFNSNELCTDAIAPSNNMPTISGTPNPSAAEGEAYGFTPSASDQDGDSLSFSITNKPAWASFDSGTGRLSGTPGYGDAGVYSNIVIGVSDGSDSTSLSPFTITITETNQSPVINGNPSNSVAENAAYSFSPSASDPDGDSLTFSITNRPNWASFNQTNGTLSGVPGFDAAGSYENIVISVTDGSATALLAAFSINVENTNRVPSISGIPTASVAEGSAYIFTPTVADPDGDTLSFTLVNVPSWASFNTSNGTLSGTPGFTDAGTYSNIEMSVSDGSANISLTPFNITVVNTENGGEFNFSNNSQSVVEGSSISITITRSNGEGEVSVMYGTNGVSAFHGDDYWGFNPIELTFINGETSKVVSVQTIDNTIAESEETFEVYLTAPSAGYSLGTKAVITASIIDNDEAANNIPPVISGTPAASVTSDIAYSFTPTTLDPDGDIMTFSITNAPSWASFNYSTGTLTGVPDITDVGVYEGIIITVSDGTDSTSLNAFSIQVNAASSGTGSADLSWEIPTTRTDGSPLALSEIDGYRIYMGPTSDNLSMVLDLNDGSATSYSLTDLASGNYYFTITTYDLNENESSFSNVASKTIP